MSADGPVRTSSPKTALISDHDQLSRPSSGATQPSDGGHLFHPDDHQLTVV